MVNILTNKNFWGILFLIFGLSYVIWSSMLKEHQMAYVKHLDGRYIYVSGACWLSGQSPYNVNAFGNVWEKHMINEQIRKEFTTDGDTIALFAYPPTLGIISIPLAFFSWEMAKHVLDLMNMLFLLLIAFFSAMLIRDLPQTQFHFGKIGIGIGLSCLIAAIPTTLFLGQTSLIALMGCLGMIYFSQRQKFLTASLFVVFASIKPHVSLLLVIYWLVREKNWRFFGWSALLVSITSMSILWLGGIYHSFSEISNVIDGYRSIEFNTPSNMSGFYTILGSMGFDHRVTSILPIIGLTIVVALALLFRRTEIRQHKRSKNSETEIGAMNHQNLWLMVLVFSLTALFMPIHGYDYTIFFLAIMLLVTVRWHLVVFLLPGIILVARPGNSANLLSNMGDIPISAIMLGSLGAIYLTVAITVMIIWSSWAKEKVTSI